MFLYFCQKKPQKRHWKIYNYFHYQENVKLILFAQEQHYVKLMLKFCISIVSVALMLSSAMYVTCKYTKK